MSLFCLTRTYTYDLKMSFKCFIVYSVLLLTYMVIDVNIVLIVSVGAKNQIHLETCNFM